MSYGGPMARQPLGGRPPRDSAGKFNHLHLSTVVRRATITDTSLGVVYKICFCLIRKFYGTAEGNKRQKPPKNKKQLYY